VTTCPVHPNADEHSVAALAALVGAGGRVVDQIDPDGYDLGVDGLTGLGYQRRPAEAEESIASRATQLRELCDLIVAVDLPSGVVADTGDAATWAVQAGVTVTFGALKTGLVVGRGADLAGLIDVVDIGLEATNAHAGVLDADDVDALLPAADSRATKYTRGVVGLVAGGPDYVGAAVLAAGGALRAGAGMVRLHAHPAAIDAVRARWPETVGILLDPDAIRADTKVDAWVVGPGLGTDDVATSAVRAVLSRQEPVVVDADAITIGTAEPSLLGARTAPSVVTPHSGEFGRLTGISGDDIASDPLGVARVAAARLGVTMLLKGMRTVVCDPDGEALVNTTGTPWLATAGTGDVLAGAIGALLAAGLAPSHAAGVAAWLHGLAGRLAAQGAPLLATDVVDTWSHAVRLVRDQRG